MVAGLQDKLEIPRSDSGAKQAAKKLARGIARGLILPLYLLYRCWDILLGEQAFRDSSQLLSLLPGLAGDYLRREFYSLTIQECGAEVQIVFGTLFSSRSARIAEHVYIGAYCMIGDAEIKSDTLIGSNVHIIGPAQHGFADLNQPIRFQPGKYKVITIGEDSWIGNGAIVMANVGRKCVIGAGSVVTSDIPDYSIAVGNPCRVLRKREGTPKSSDDKY